MAVIASSACGVRRVTSITGSAAEQGLGHFDRVIHVFGVYTGITGASFRTARTRGSAADIESLLAHQGQHVSFADRIEIAGDGVLQRPGQAEPHGGVGIKAGQDAMQDAGREASPPPMRSTMPCR